MSASQQHPVSLPTAAWAAAEDQWRLLRTLRGGQRAVWAAGQEYLPPYQGEDLSSPWGYPARLRRSTLYNATARAVTQVVGKVFARPIGIGADVPDALRAWCEDVDLRGTHFHEFLRAVFIDAWWYGFGLFLVDMPPAPEHQLTRAEELALGRRPYLVRYRPEDLIGIRTGAVNGRWRLLQARLRERVEVEDGEFTQRTEDRIRVYRAPEPGTLWVTCEVWGHRAVASGGSPEWVPIEPPRPMVGMSEIPLVACYAGEVKAPYAAEPPLLDLAYLNLTHYQLLSDLRHIEHVANVPVPTFTGVDESQFRKRVRWGPSGALLLPAGAGYGYFEHSGKCIAELKQSIAKVEEQMRLLSYEPFLPRESGGLTATGEAIRAAEAHSAVQTSARSLEDAAEQGLRLMARWAGIEADAAGVADSGGSVLVNHDLAMPVGNEQTVTVLANLNLTGRLTTRRLWAELQRRNILGPDFDPEAEEKALGVEGIEADGGGAPEEADIEAALAAAAAEAGEGA